MRKFLLSFFLLLNFAIIPHLSSRTVQWGVFELSEGFREDRLHWSISPYEYSDSSSYFCEHVNTTSSSSSSSSGSSSSSSSSSGSFDKISKLRWKGLHIGQIMLTGRYVNCYRFYFRGYADYGRIFEGKETDTDFSGNPAIRTFPHSKSTARADKGEVYDFSAGIGYQFRFLCGRATITPIAGYSYHAQHLRMDHEEIICNVRPGGFVGSVDGVHNNYRTRWKGPWLGVDFTLYMTCDLKLFGSAEYHWTLFHARGHWNLREDFVKDFHQHAKGRGFVYTLGASYDVWDNWTIGLVGGYQAWRTWRGLDKVYLFDGPLRSRLNVVHWHSIYASVMVGYEF